MHNAVKLENVESLKKGMKRNWWFRIVCLYWIATSLIGSDYRIHLDAIHANRAAFGVLGFAILFSYSLIMKRKLRVAEESLKATFPSYTPTHWMNARI